MAAGQAGSATFRDHKNQTAVMRFWVPAGAGGGSTITAIAAVAGAAAGISNANVRASTAPPSAVVSGTSAEYDTVEDKAQFTFTTDDGSLHRFQVPAPKGTIFLADQETVDYTNADVATFVAAVLANVVARDGTALSASVGGQRLRKRSQRRFNIFTRNPTLTGQGL